MNVQIDAFLVGFLGILVGMAILLYGVILTSGQALNSFMIVGGLIILVMMAMMTYATATGSSGRELDQ